MKENTVKLNSRACNLRHLQDALCALSAAASDARVRHAKALSSPSPLAPLPPSPHADRGVLGAAKRAREVGATPREIAGATLLPLEWAYGAAKYGAPGRPDRYTNRVGV